MQNIQVQPIVSLTPFMGNRWWIKARVVDKSDIRTWNKPTSQGKLFSCTLVDETSGIRATFFNGGVDNYYDMLTTGQIYYFSAGSIKTANKKFNNVNNEYEVSFDEKAQIQKCNEAANNAIPMQRWNFVPIETLATKEEGSMVDVLAVVSSVEEPTDIIQKSTGKALTKRSLILADKTASVELTLWNEKAQDFHYPVGTILSVKGCKIGKFRGTNLSTSMGSVMDDKCDVSDVRALRDLYTQGSLNKVPCLSRQESEFTGQPTQRRFLTDVSRLGLGRGEKPDYIEVRLMPTFIKTDSLWYEACPKCNKKVALPEGGSTGRCEKCDVTVAPEARYMASIQASDNVEQQWLTLFNEAGEALFGKTAPELKQMAQNDPQALARIAQEKLYKPTLMKLRVKEERRDDGPRVSLTVVKVTPLVHEDSNGPASITKECKQIIDNIAAYN